MFDGEMLGKQLTVMVRDFVARSMAPLLERMGVLEASIATIPAGKDGAPGKDGEKGMPGERGEMGAKGEPGTKGDPGERGADGLPGKDGERGADGAPGKDGAPGVDGKDGSAGLNGKDGAPGKDGETPSVPTIIGALGPELMNLCSAEVMKAVALIPKANDGRDGLPGIPGRDGADGKKGKDGTNGIDGFGLDDFDVSLADDGRSLTFRFARGEVVKERVIKTAWLLDRGVYKETAYDRGDGVTRGGSFWIAQRDLDPNEKPGDCDAWRLSVKRGADGKDAAPLPKAAEPVRIR